MTARPDPRLLLPASAVKRVPACMPAWLVDGRRAVVVSRSLADDRIIVACLTDGEREFLIVDRAAVSYDLSAPVDGERLDAREWALGALARLLGGSGSAALSSVLPAFGYVLRWGDGVASIATPGTDAAYLDGFTAGGTRGTVLHVDVDLSGLTPGDAARAVVVAALVARGGAR